MDEVVHFIQSVPCDEGLTLTSFIKTTVLLSVKLTEIESPSRYLQKITMLNLTDVRQSCQYVNYPTPAITVARKTNPNSPRRFETNRSNPSAGPQVFVAASLSNHGFDCKAGDLDSGPVLRIR